MLVRQPIRGSGPSKRIPVELVRFIVVGGLCFFSGLTLLYLLTEWLRLHYLVSMSISLIAVNVLGWLLNRSWTFQVQARGSWQEWLRYLVVNAVAFAVTLALLALFVSRFGMNYLVASVVIGALMTLTNYFAHRRWSLRPRPIWREP